MYRTGPMRSRAVEQGEAGLRAAISGARVCFTEETLPFWMRGNLNRFVEVKKKQKTLKRLFLLSSCEPQRGNAQGFDPAAGGEVAAGQCCAGQC